MQANEPRYDQKLQKTRTNPNGKQGNIPSLKIRSANGMGRIVMQHHGCVDVGE
jgi:hypothetical protein